MKDMHDEMITVVTERGQTSIPAKLRRKAGLSRSKRLHWYAVSNREFRVVIETPDEAPGPLAALGWAVRFNRRGVPRSDDAMREIREGEDA
jgi:bifunctional DNA-binding transcriptional regulator/antitoxin component of YhaV-PrlF toxin-antitoxin module